MAIKFVLEAQKSRLSRKIQICHREDISRLGTARHVSIMQQDKYLYAK